MSILSSTTSSIPKRLLSEDGIEFIFKSYRVEYSGILSMRRILLRIFESSLAIDRILTLSKN